MKIASAQISVIDKDINYNISKHIHCCEIAIENQVKLIVFPEMSLTGYLRKDASSNTFTMDDARLNVFKSVSKRGNLIIIVGAPIKINDKVHIGEFIIYPNGNTNVYTKQYLHDGEEIYFYPTFEYNPQIIINDETISLAICADIENQNHIFNAKSNQATFYLASIFYLEQSMDKLHSKLSSYSKEYKLNVLISNFVDNSFNLKAGGKSGFWNQSGEIISSADKELEQLIIIEKKKKEWHSEIKPLY